MSTKLMISKNSSNECFFVSAFQIGECFNLTHTIDVHEGYDFTGKSKIFNIQNIQDLINEKNTDFSSRYITLSLDESSMVSRAMRYIDSGELMESYSNICQKDRAIAVLLFDNDMRALTARIEDRQTNKRYPKFVPAVISKPKKLVVKTSSDVTIRNNKHDLVLTSIDVAKGKRGQLIYIIAKMVNAKEVYIQREINKLPFILANSNDLEKSNELIDRFKKLGATLEIQKLENKRH